MKVHKFTRSTGDPIEERKRSSIAGLQGAFLICTALSFILFAPLVSADKEPNDHIEEAETVKERVQGIVDIEPMFDVDYYKIDVRSEATFRLKLTLKGSGMIQLYTTTEPDGNGFSTNLYVDDFSPSDELKFPEGEHNGMVLCFIEGKGAYVLEVLVPKDHVEVKGPSKELIIFISMGAFLLIFLLLVSALFIKMVRMKKEDRMDRALKTEIPYEEAMERRCFKSDFDVGDSPYSIPDKNKTSCPGDMVCYYLPKGENGRRLVTPIEEWREEFEEDPY